MSFAYDYAEDAGGLTLLSLCEYGGDVVAEVTASEGVAPVLAEMIDELLGETHYTVLEDTVLEDGAGWASDSPGGDVFDSPPGR